MNDFFRPIFCDTDPVKAAECLDDLTLMKQISSVSLLVLAVEAVAFRVWHTMKTRDPGFKPPFDFMCEADYPVSTYLLTAYSMEAREWACRSQPAAKWLIDHAVALVTEAEFRGLNPDPSIVRAMHFMLVRRDTYAAAFKGNPTAQATKDFPSFEPEFHIVRRYRRLLILKWQEYSPVWTGKPGPNWWEAESRKIKLLLASQASQALAQTLVDRSSLQA